MGKYTFLKIVVKQKKDSNIPCVSPNKLSYIDNSKYLLPNQPVSIDLEKVLGYESQLPGWVVICIKPTNQIQRKERIQIILSAKIRQFKSKVKSYQTKYSGLARIDLSEDSVDFKDIKEQLKSILKNRVVIGIGLKEDLKCIQMEDVVKHENRVEFNDIFLDDKRQPIGLKSLAFAFLGKRIQEFDPEYVKFPGHSPVMDARITIQIYQKIQTEKILEKQKTDFQWIRDMVNQALLEGQLKNYRKNKTNKKTNYQNVTVVYDKMGNPFRLA